MKARDKSGQIGDICDEETLSPYMPASGQTVRLFSNKNFRRGLVALHALYRCAILPPLQVRIARAERAV